MKKNWRNSGFRRDTTMNHGTVIARKSGIVTGKCHRRQWRTSRVTTMCTTSVPAMSTSAAIPLLSTARASDAEATAIHPSSALE